jgi:hypothetical protein
LTCRSDTIRASTCDLAARHSSQQYGGSVRIYTAGVSVGVLICLSAPAAAQSAATYKVAWYNIKSGLGENPLAGHPAAGFVDNYNCTDPTQPLNAWGVGLVQAELRARVGNDPAVIAIGLAEAWRCGTLENVRKTLGWAARTTDRNGLGLVVRHGFAAPDQWIQLDTSLNTNPADTQWVVRAQVCVDAACTHSIPVFATHWWGTGTLAVTTYERQLRATIAFMALEERPHVLVGDLNIFEGTTTVCRNLPINTLLPILRESGYVDAWPAVHGSAEGYTGTVNRKGCGVPEGYSWKRIDYAWVKGFPIAGMSRFGMSPPGDASLSDHYGITLAIAGAQPPAPPDMREVVLRVSSAVTVTGIWGVQTDPTAAEGRLLRTVDRAAPKLTTAAAAPSSYVDFVFNAEAGRPYRIWIRGRAERNSYSNDSVFVQFGGAITSAGAPLYRVGSTAATIVVIEDCAGCGLSGWGWQDNAYGLGAFGPLLRFETTGRQTLRIQSREDGLSIDQVVLSSQRYLDVAPGLARQDTTILP